MSFTIKPPLAPMEAKSVEELPSGKNWQYEPKWDGFRCIAFRDRDHIYLQSKSGQPLARYFPDVVEALEKLPAANFVLDGELAIPVHGALSFDQLQLRLHPAASRVAKLASAHPAIFIVFDLLAEKRTALVTRALSERRKLLEEFARINFKKKKIAPTKLGGSKPGSLALSPATTDLAKAKRWLEKVGGDLDGVMAKRLDQAYASGQRTAMVKIKRIRSADCVVGGFRYASRGKSIGSLLLGLYDDKGLLHHVGFTSAFKTQR